MVKEDDFSELDSLLSYLSRAVDAATKQDQTQFDADILTRYQVIDSFLDSIEDGSSDKEFAAYLAPKLLGDSID